MITLFVIIAGYVLLGWNPVTWGGWAIFLFVLALVEFLLQRINEVYEKKKK